MTEMPFATGHPQPPPDALPSVSRDRVGVPNRSAQAATDPAVVDVVGRSGASPTRRRGTASHRRLLRRQRTVVIALATLVGLWFGLSAPSLSPVSPPMATPEIAASILPAATPTNDATIQQPTDLAGVRASRSRP